MGDHLAHHVRQRLILQRCELDPAHAARRPRAASGARGIDRKLQRKMRKHMRHHAGLATPARNTGKRGRLLQSRVVVLHGAVYGPTGNLAKRIASDEAADLVILGGEQTAELTKQGKLAAGSTTDVARGMIGAGIAKGAPKPDISSEAAFRTALLNAKSP